MVRVRFDTEALTRVRFAISPMLETIRSVSALEDPASGAIHLPWVEQARELTGDLDLTLLRVLQLSEIYDPDFVNPPPSCPLAEFEEELDVMVSTPAAQIRAEVAHAYENRAMPAVLEPFLSRPRAAVRELAELMREYWERSLAAHWPRMRALLEQDVLYRARQIADGGTRRLFCDLDPAVSWKDGILQVDCATEKTLEHELELDERGLLLVPSAFVWPKVRIVTAAPWQPTLIYPARGIGMLWDAERPVPPDALANLVGQTRAALLLTLDCPRSTTELAATLGMSPGGVSQHLSILREAGLVSGNRLQRVVLYMRSTDGDSLVRASTAQAQRAG
jgi:DNA-binding transcriptional ArsR family regulator